MNKGDTRKVKKVVHHKQYEETPNRHTVSVPKQMKTIETKRYSQPIVENKPKPMLTNRPPRPRRRRERRRKESDVIGYICTQMYFNSSLCCE